MIRKSLFVLALAAAFPAAAEDFVRAAATPRAKAPVAAAGGAPTAADVGDADSFGRDVKWLGLLSGYARLSLDCTADPADTSPCTTIAASGPTDFDFPALDTLSLPARASTSLLCHWQTPVVGYFAHNPHATAQMHTMRLTPYYTLESSVFDGLSDPNTGVPYAGRIELGLTSISTGQTLQPGESLQDIATGTRACIGGLVSRASLQQQWGLTAAQADEFFRRPVTITLGLRGSARLVEDANINVGTRFTGD
jgi:hypothetical protein